MAQVTEKDAIIVAHGSPSHPSGQEAALTALAAETAAHLPGWRLRSATLAAPGALDAALSGTAQPFVYPLFMAPGWFVDTHLPARLAGRGGPRLAPLGLDPALPRLAAQMIAQHLATEGLQARETTLLIAAHGSPKRPESARAARRFAAALERTLPMRALRLGFVEEAPFLTDAAAIDGPALCLPFFATEAGHVTQDIAAALEAARFTGPVLPPAIRYPGLPRLIATALMGAAAQRSAA